MELMACADLVGDTTEESCPFCDLKCLSLATAICVVDCCQFGQIWIFGLKMELMACADLVGGTKEQSILFPDLKHYYQ